MRGMSLPPRIPPLSSRRLCECSQDPVLGCLHIRAEQTARLIGVTKPGAEMIFHKYFSLLIHRQFHYFAPYNPKHNPR